jgi:hypothetical protein
VTTILPLNVSNNILSVSASVKSPGSVETQLGFTMIVSEFNQGSVKTWLNSAEPFTFEKVVGPNLCWEIVMICSSSTIHKTPAPRGNLGRILQEAGKQQEARQQLGETYAWFNEGFETPDLRAAKEILEALSPN